MQDSYKLFQKFSNHAHSGSVKSIAFSPSSGMLVSGGSDEICHLLDLKRRKELGNLIEQEGAITWIEFFGNRHMFTASEDRSICVWNTKTWECVKKLVGHKSAVTGLAIHPTGKLMLSIGKDKTVRTWNLIQGRCAFVTNLKEPASLVRWVPDGKRFVLVYDKRVDMYCATNCGVIRTIEQEHGINCLLFLTDSLIAVGAENESILLYDIDEARQVFAFKAHERRVKSICQVPKEALPGLRSTVDHVICSTSSDGTIKIWSLELTSGSNAAAELVAEINSKCRPNCVTIASVSDSQEEQGQDAEHVQAGKKRKQGEKKTKKKMLKKK